MRIGNTRGPAPDRRLWRNPRTVNDLSPRHLACPAYTRTIQENRESIMPHEPHRTARSEARIAPEALAVVKRAAELQGRSVSDFVVAAAQEAATRAIEEMQIVRLSVEDQHAFLAAILDPPSPTAALVRAAGAHRRLIRN
ncbi:MAG: DUF1778 domain-containing protein [Acetobacteraceae bacterium]